MNCRAPYRGFLVGQPAVSGAVVRLLLHVLEEPAIRRSAVHRGVCLSDEGALVRRARNTVDGARAYDFRLAAFHAAIGKPARQAVQTLCRRSTIRRAIAKLYSIAQQNVLRRAG